ncbi:MAG: hypoxanthine phosphoribosyltransferase [Acidobacteria bacterium]|nr:hypoxanthine phosphoribosyltransferase [Acidobacteriota bacterium]
MKVVLAEEQIQSRVREMAENISQDYDGEVVDAIGILENGFVFLADLVRNLKCPVVCHFLKMETVDTRGAEGHQPLRNIVYGPLGNVEGKNLLLVDAMVDSGITLDHLIQQLLFKKPKSLRTAALLDREDRRRVPLVLDYKGFTWSGGHVVGYGMEKGGLYRNLPYIAAVDGNS